MRRRKSARAPRAQRAPDAQSYPPSGGSNLPVYAGGYQPPPGVTGTIIDAELISDATGVRTAGYGIGASFLAGAFASNFQGAANIYAAQAGANAAGNPYDPMLQAQGYGRIGGNILGLIGGGLIGMRVGGLPGALFGMYAGMEAFGGMGAGIGEIFSATRGGEYQLAEQQRLAQQMTGISVGALRPIAGGAFSGVNDPIFGGGVTPGNAWRALSGVSGIIAGGGTGGDLGGAASALIQRYGSPVLPTGQQNAAFNAAATSLAPFLSDPFEMPGYVNALRNGELSASSMMGSLLHYGPGATWGAVATLGRGNTQAFSRMNARMRGFDFSENVGASAAIASSYGSQLAQLTGDPGAISSALGEEAGAYGNLGSRFGREMDYLMPMQGDPYVAERIGSLQGQRAAAALGRRQSQFAAATMGPGADWTIRTNALQTQMQITSMDPFFSFTDPHAARSLYGQYGSRISQLQSQAEGDPAAQAANAPMISQLQVAQKALSNQMQMGIMGQALDIYQGAPNGFQAWGLQGMSFGALQSAVPGSPRGLGGSGELSLGDVKETNRLLMQILMALNNNRTLAPTAGGESFYTLAPDRANRKIGR